jgi:hypothetical protein
MTPNTIAIRDAVEMRIANGNAFQPHFSGRSADVTAVITATPNNIM